LYFDYLHAIKPDVQVIKEEIHGVNVTMNKMNVTMNELTTIMRDIGERIVVMTAKDGGIPCRVGVSKDNIGNVYDSSHRPSIWCTVSIIRDGTPSNADLFISTEALKILGYENLNVGVFNLHYKTPTTTK
jgi:hypothetical protein